MTTISTSTLSPYASSFSVTIKKDESATAAANASSVAPTLESADAARAAGASGGGGAAGSATSDPAQESIDKLKEQIKETEKQLRELQQQLASAQGGNDSDEEKAQKAMAIQAQISTTSATLQAQQAALLQLTTSGGVNTTA